MLVLATGEVALSALRRFTEGKQLLGFVWGLFKQDSKIAFQKGFKFQFLSDFFIIYAQLSNKDVDTETSRCCSKRTKEEMAMPTLGSKLHSKLKKKIHKRMCGE